MAFELIAAVNPPMGNVPANTYLIIAIAAGVLAAAAVIAGVISKKKKK